MNRGFSLIELLISLIIISILIAALTPVFTKKLNYGKTTIQNKTNSTDCIKFDPKNRCLICSKDSCILCINQINTPEGYFVDPLNGCENIKCAEKFENCAACNKDYCTKCDENFVLDSKNQCKNKLSQEWCDKIAGKDRTTFLLTGTNQGLCVIRKNPTQIEVQSAGVRYIPNRLTRIENSSYLNSACWQINETEVLCTFKGILDICKSYGNVWRLIKYSEINYLNAHPNIIMKELFYFNMPRYEGCGTTSASSNRDSCQGLYFFIQSPSDTLDYRCAINDSLEIRCYSLAKDDNRASYLDGHQVKCALEVNL